jgi:antitoxin (DNA-binding transcriptional repressor) of toxin-antitoxin stability system
MVTKRIDVESSETSLKDLLALALEGTEIILTEGDTPIIRLLPEALSNTPRVLGLHPGIWMSDDFDEPLPDEFWLGEDT